MWFSKFLPADFSGLAGYPLGLSDGVTGRSRNCKFHGSGWSKLRLQRGVRGCREQKKTGLVGPVSSASSGCGYITARRDWRCGCFSGWVRTRPVARLRCLSPVIVRTANTDRRRPPSKNPSERGKQTRYNLHAAGHAASACKTTQKSSNRLIPQPLYNQWVNGKPSQSHHFSAPIGKVLHSCTGSGASAGHSESKWLAPVSPL